jgi:glycosyltransferase involved in cell wall biosynthesis
MKLTFIIPTYNRVRFLEKGLYRLVSEIKAHQFEHQIEIIIGNNCSIDETAEFLDEWENKNSKLNIEIHHHKSNLGVVKNLIYLIEQVKGDFWMFYGDDDFIPKGVLPDLMEHLYQYSDYPIHIFNQTKFQPITKVGPISVEECASRYFYYMGNACTVAKTSLSQNVIKKFSNEIKQTCWPQTHVYFLAGISANKSEPVFLSSINVYSEQPQNLNNIFNSFRCFDAAIFSLLKLSYILKKQNSKFQNINFNKGITELRKENYFNYLFKQIFFMYKLIDTPKEQSDFRKIYFEALGFLSLKDKVYLIPCLFGLLTPKKVYYFFYLTLYGLFKKDKGTFIQRVKEKILIIKKVKESKEKSKNLLHSHTNFLNSW